MTATPRLDPARCAPSAQRRGDLRVGTAAPVAHWLLIERPGAWGRLALTESGLDPDVATRLAHRASAAGVRIQLIRRGRVAVRPSTSPSTDLAVPEPPTRRWAFVDSTRSPTRGIRWGEFADEAELLELAWDGTDGRPSTEPIFLVCTHGRHDACCALLGRPVLRALLERYPEQTWEISHVGGDRFSANLVVLPTGLYYGGLDPDSAPAVVEAYGRGLLEPEYLRGRCADPGPAQAAEHFAREYLGDQRIDAVHPVEVRPLGDATWRVRLSSTVSGNELTVEIREGRTEQAAQLTCQALRPSYARTYDLVTLRPD